MHPIFSLPSLSLSRSRLRLSSRLFATHSICLGQSIGGVGGVGGLTKYAAMHKPGVHKPVLDIDDSVAPSATKDREDNDLQASLTAE